MKRVSFVWTDRLIESATKHGVDVEAIEHVVRNSRSDRRVREGMYKAVGQTPTGEYAEAIYARVTEGSPIDWEEVHNLSEIDLDVAVYVFHARYL